MSRSIFLRPLAHADLRAIWDFTAAQWSPEKAEDHLSGLGRLFELLAQHPEIARERPEFHPPVRLHPYLSHLVIFTNTDEVLEVISVVHRRANWSELLTD